MFHAGSRGLGSKNFRSSSYKKTHRVQAMFPDHLSVSYDYARAGSAIKGHLDNCSNVEHLFFIINFILNNVKTHECRLNLVRQNTRITDLSSNWNVLLFKETYHIKKNSPVLINGFKVSREIQLFWMSFNYNVYANHILTVSCYCNVFSDYILLVIKLV